MPITKTEIENSAKAQEIGDALLNAEVVPEAESEGNGFAFQTLKQPDGEIQLTKEIAEIQAGQSRLCAYGSNTLGAQEPVGQRTRDGVRDVWKHNLFDEVLKMTEYLGKYNIIAMDTEFPGIVAELKGSDFDCMNRSDKLYNTIRTNVNVLKLIQLGITLMDKNGNTPPGILGWQFNFKFDVKNDYHAIPSINLLKNAGLEFEKFAEDGIEPMAFAEQFSLTGLIVSDKVSWVSFHSGYDFAYLYKVILGHNLPKRSSDFFETLMWLFPRFYDCKFLMRYCHQLHGSLQQVGHMLNIEHNGIPHQAGCDAYLTGRVFIRMVESYFPKNCYEQHYGQIFGFDSDLMLEIRQKITNIRNGHESAYLSNMFEQCCIDPAPTSKLDSRF